MVFIFRCGFQIKEGRFFMREDVKFSELENRQRFYIDKYATAVDLYISSKDEFERQRYTVDVFAAQEVITFIGSLCEELDPDNNMIYSVSYKKWCDYIFSK